MIGAKVREIRQSKGVTQQYIIAKMGKHKSWLSQIEYEHVEINAEDLKRVADILNTPISQFFLPVNLTNSKIDSA